MSGEIAVVTGASRGAGKGIAIALGSKGMTVYVTGRSTRPDATPYGGTVAETAQAVTAAGGRGVAVACDHADDVQVAALFATVKADHGRLDILVNNAAHLPDTGSGAGAFWEKPLGVADLITVGLRSHYVASWHAAPLMIAGGRGLIVNTGHYGAVSYFLNPAYGAQKAGADKLAADMAKELRPHNVSANALWLGSVATERSHAYLSRLPPEQRAGVRQESAQFSGLVIAALYASPDRMVLSGQALIGAELGARLGVRDLDDSAPVSQRERLGGPPVLHASLQP